MASPNRKYRRRVRWRWVLVAATALVAFVLGLAGFERHFVERGIAKSRWDLVYLTLQLFTLESGAVEGRVNAPLEIARLLAPVSTAYTIVNAVLGLFSVRLQKIWIWLRGDHVVVCGLGRKGLRLVEQLRAPPARGSPWSAGRRERVVVIETDEQNSALQHCRDLGCVVLTGRADDEWNLRAACLERAKLLIAVTGDDGVNVETAVRAHQLVQKRRGSSLKCVVHLSDPDLQGILRQHDIFTDEQDPIDLEFFNAYETGARVMLQLCRALEPARAARHPEIHLLIVGLGDLGEAVLTRAIKDWQVEFAERSRPLRISVIDIEAEQARRRIVQRFPQLVTACQMDYYTADIRLFRLSEELGPDLHRTLAAAFICLDDDARAAYAALRLRRDLEAGVPIVVRMSEEAGLATLLGTEAHGVGVIPGTNAVGLMDVACALELVLGGTREILAQAIHREYVTDQLAAGQTVAENTSLRPWHRLPEPLRESNRKQADDMRAKLKAIGCSLVTVTGRCVESIEFSQEEIERLARKEHERWLDERRAAGWTYGPQRDAERRTNPFLVPWDELPEDAKRTNHNAIRRMPKVLAKADFEIRRNH